MKFALLLVLGSCVLSACGKRGGDASDDRAKVLASRDFAGQWVSNCTRAKAIGYAQISRLEITETDFNERIVTGGSGRCEGGDIEIATRGTYERAIDAREGLNGLDVKVVSVRVKPLTARGLNILRAAKFCGTSSWQAETEREVKSLACVEKAATTFDVFAIEGGKLYFGNDPDVKSAANRPSDLERAEFYVRH